MYTYMIYAMSMYGYLRLMLTSQIKFVFTKINVGILHDYELAVRVILFCVVTPTRVGRHQDINTSTCSYKIQNPATNKLLIFTRSIEHFFIILPIIQS
jgi:hypothetical protein